MLRRRLLWMGLLMGCGSVSWYGYRTFRQAGLNHALLMAAARSDPGTVRTLLAEGANPNAQEERFARSVWQRAMDFLFQNTRRRPMITALSQALSDHALDEPRRAVLQILLDGGANPNILLPDGRQLLFQVLDIQEKQTGAQDDSLLMLFLQHGAEPNRVDPGGTFLLMRAVIANRETWVRDLLAHGARADVTSYSGDTPLMMAAHTGNRSIITNLLAHDAGVNSKDGMGQTPLIYSQTASRASAHAAVEILLRAGADVNTPNIQGCTPFLFAMLNHSPDIPAMLAHGADVRTAIPAAATSQMIYLKHPPITQMVSFSKPPGTTALMFAAQWKDPELVRFLLARQAPVNVKNAAGKTALDFAEGDPKISALLRNAGAAP